MSDTDKPHDEAEPEFIELDESEAPEVVEAAAPAPEPADTPKTRRRPPAVAKDEPAPRTVAADPPVSSHPLLTAAEVAEAKAKARSKLDKERRLAAMKAVEDAETERLKREEGLVTGDGAKDEMVDITLDLAPFTEKIVLNSVPYWHSFTYPVPRHVADTLRDIQAQGWKHQDEIDGKGLAQHYQANRRTHIKQVGRAIGVAGAPKSFAAEELRA